MSVTVTATELKTNFGKYLDMISLDRVTIFITKNGKITGKLTNPNVSVVDSISGILKGKVSEDTDISDIRKERLDKYETGD